MKNIKTLFLFSSLAAFALLLFNCGSPDDTVWTDDGNDSTSYFSIRMDETELQGAGIYTIYADAALPQAVYTASLGGETINFVLEEGDSSLVFLMPFIDTGSYELIIDSLEANPISIIVVEAEKIDNPDALIEADIAEVDTLINQVNRASRLGYNISESQMAELSNFSAELKTMVNELSADDKEKLAIFLNANWVHLPDFEPLLIADSLVSNKRAAANPTAELERLSNWFVISLTTTIATLPPLYKLITVAPANPWALAGAGALAFTCGTAFIATQVIVEQIGELRGVADNLEADLGRKKALEMYNGIKKTVWPRINYRTIQRGDANSGIGFISDMIGQLFKFENLWAKMVSCIEWVENKLGTDIVSLQESPLNIDEAPKKRPFTPDYQNVSLGSVTNGVQLRRYIENGSLRLEASSNEDKQFQFDLVYRDSKYGFELTQSYHAEVIATVDSTIIYQDAAIGEWSVTGLEAGGNTRKLKLFEGGEGRYIIPGPDGAGRDGVDQDGNSYYIVSWKIVKKDNRYFLSEDGFWHFGFEAYRSYDISLPENALKFPVRTFLTYTDFGDGPGDAGRRYTKN